MHGAVADPVVVRGLESNADFDAMAAVREACREVDSLDYAYGGQQLREALATIPEAQPDRQIFLATVAGEVVGHAYGFAEGESETEGRVLWHQGFVRPDWRGAGIGRRLLPMAQEAARRHGVRRFGTAPERVRFRVLTPDTAVAARHLLEHDGFEVAQRMVTMVRLALDHLERPALPAGLEIRPASRATALQILRASDEASRDQRGYVGYTDEALELLADHPLTGQLDVWQVAWDGAEVAGGVLGFIDRHENEVLDRRRGYAENAFVRGPWRRQGLATALMGRCLEAMVERGMSEAALTVDDDGSGGALRLAQRTGFVPERTTLVMERPA